MAMTSIDWQGEAIPVLGLGTAQLGRKYGITNKTGKPTPEQAQEMLRFAWDRGVRHFDTSQDYDESEVVLGEFFGSLTARDRGAAVVTTKLSRSRLAAGSSRIEESIERSRRTLGLDRIWGLMLYGDDAVDWYPAMAVVQRKCKDGLITHLGLSVTYPREAIDALHDPRVDFIQVPCNAWNASMERHGVFDLAKDLKKLCFLRSVYLQGLIVAPPDQAAAKMPVVGAAVIAWQELVADLDLGDAVQVALRFAMSPGLPVVVGAETLRQLRETLAVSRMKPLNSYAWDRIYKAMRRYVNPSVTYPREAVDSILDPRLW